MKLSLPWEGKMIERGPTAEIFDNPKDNRTKAFISGEIY